MFLLHLPEESVQTVFVNDSRLLLLKIYYFWEKLCSANVEFLQQGATDTACRRICGSRNIFWYVFATNSFLVALSWSFFIWYSSPIYLDIKFTPLSPFLTITTSLSSSFLFCSIYNVHDFLQVVELPENKMVRIERMSLWNPCSGGVKVRLLLKQRLNLALLSKRTAPS